MEEKVNKLFKDVGNVSVDANDIYALIKIVKENEKAPAITHPEDNKFTLEVDDYILESEDELNGFNNKKVKKISIKFYSFASHYFLFEIDKNGATVFCDNNQTFCYGLFNKAVETLSKRKRKFQWSSVLIRFVPALSLGPVFLLISDKGDPLYYIGLITSLFINIVAILYLIGIPFRKTIISLSEIKQTYWEKNKDQIGTIIIGAVIGGIITVLTTIILFSLGILK